MSQLVYNQNGNLVTLYDLSGAQVGQWAAHNNAASNSGGPFPLGSWTYSWRNPHAENTSPDSAYGSHGIFIFAVTGKTGMGVHSGRAMVADQLGRTGTEHATMGCVRTSDTAMQAILNHTQTDPMTTFHIFQNSNTLPAP